MTLNEALLDEAPRRELAFMDRDDGVVSDEDRDLVVVDHTRGRRLECIEDDEVVGLVLIDLGSLVAVTRVFDGKRVKLELFGDEIELFALRI